MHFLRTLITILIPPKSFVLGGEPVPPGLDLVVTNTGAFVITSRGNEVAAKKYV